MNRGNYWIHIMLAIGFISVAAIIGQISRWESSWNSQELPVVYEPPIPKTFPESKPKTVAESRSSESSEPEVMVKFHTGVSLSEIKKIVLKHNDRVEDNLEVVNGLVAIDDLDDKTSDEVAKEYNSMSGLVDYAEPVMQIHLDPLVFPKSVVDETDSNGLANAPSDPMFEDQWALNNVGQEGGKKSADVSALKAWNKTTGSEEVVVAVLDSGVDYTHSDLVGNIWFRPDNIPEYQDEELGTIDDEHGFNSAENSADPMDDNGHGTHCAGIIGAEGDNEEGIAGINWKVEIMPLKFIGKGGFGTTKDAIEAINYAVQRKRDGVNVRIISASWGSTAYSKALEDAIRAAGEEGILFVAAAGNDGSSNDSRPHYPSNYNLPNVISVAALDRNDQLASFSNFGKKTVHIAAPGKDILSTWLGDKYREASGTSMATPYVSGVAALILATNPDLPIKDLRERLLKSVDKLDSLKGKIETEGRINAAKAVGE